MEHRRNSVNILTRDQENVMIENRYWNETDQQNAGASATAMDNY